MKSEILDVFKHECAVRTVPWNIVYNEHCFQKMLPRVCPEITIISRFHFVNGNSVHFYYRHRINPFAWLKLIQQSFQPNFYGMWIWNIERLRSQLVRQRNDKSFFGFRERKQKSCWSIDKKCWRNMKLLAAAMNGFNKKMYLHYWRIHRKLKILYGCPRHIEPMHPTVFVFAFRCLIPVSFSRNLNRNFRCFWQIDEYCLYWHCFMLLLSTFRLSNWKSPMKTMSTYISYKKYRYSFEWNMFDALRFFFSRNVIPRNELWRWHVRCV